MVILNVKLGAKKVKYPKFLNDNSCIGLLATSCGNNVNPYRIRLKKGIEIFLNKGYKIKKGHRLYSNFNAVSAPHILRASDFNKMYKNKNVDFIWSTGGGEIMIGMLEYIDFEKIKSLPPKFFMGFSDNTNLTFTLTTICDVATIYGTNIGAFAYEIISEDTIDNYKLMQKEKLSFNSYDFYLDKDIKNDNLSLKGNIYTKKVIWKSIFNNKENFTGRIIGGCLDVLVNLCGTKYDNVQEFVKKYRNEGLIWYFDVCDLTSTGLFRALFQLKEASWFKYVKGFLIGRIGNNNVILNYSFKQAIIDSLMSFNVPIIYDVDISHINPSIPIINGAIATVSYNDNKGSIKFELK